MSQPIRGLSLSLLVVSCIVQFTTALPGGLRPRQDVELPGLLGFVPSCARQCVAARVALKNCVGDGVESCLCSGDPQGFKNSVWQCIDGRCGGRESTFHQAAVVSMESLCGVPIPTETSTSTQSAVETSSRSFRSSSATTDPPIVSPTATGESSETTPISTTTDFEKDDVAEDVKERTGLSLQAIVGISVASFCLLAAVVGAFVFSTVTRKRRNHRTQIKSMTLEPHSPRGGAAVVWMSIHSVSGAAPLGGYSSDQPVPVDTNVAGKKFNAHLGGNISSVSPNILQGFEFEEAVQRQKMLENPQLFMAPPVVYTSTNPIGTVDRMSSPMPPALATYEIRPTSDFSTYDDLPGMAISTDVPRASPLPLSHSSTGRHTSSTVATLSHPNPLIPSSPPPEYAPSIISESSGSIRSFVISHGPPPVAISRSDTLSWRRELNQAAGRAVTRVLRSEQSVNEEIDAAKRRKSSIPGLDRFSKRLSRENRADEESGLVGDERGSGFWSNFGSRGSRSSRNRASPPRNSSFLGRRSNSGGSTRVQG